jgi:hypothetical protein
MLNENEYTVFKSKFNKLHKEVSLLKTPKNVIKQKMGLDYVELGYMKALADEYYPGWGWTIVRTEFLGDQAISVHGRLKFFDNGIWRECDMIAAHRIQKKKGSNEYVDVGNDIKSANTDTLKKAFNTYMNICDDIYKKFNPILSEDKIILLLSIAGEVSDERRNLLKGLIATGKINPINYDINLEKIEKERNNLKK